MQIVSAMAVGTIGVYQRYISPHKGFQCAHRVFSGGPSCSEFAKQAILAQGLIGAIPQIRHHFVECRDAYSLLQLRLHAQSPTDVDEKSPLARQGDCCVNICTLPCL